MNRSDQIRNITLIGLIVNIGLSIVKFIIGTLGNSQAVIADALHSFSDTSSDLVILFGVKYWSAPPDEEHPFGHHKIESFISILIGVILILVALGIGYEGLTTLMESRRMHLTWLSISGPLISVIVKEILFRKTYEVGIAAHSSALKANAWHHRTDAMSSIPVLITVAACLVDPRLYFLDQIGAIIVSAFIVKVGISILFNNINDLLDTGLSEDKIRAIKDTIQSIDGVKGLHNLRTRKLANYIYLDLHLEVDGQLTVTEGHLISEEVKQTLIRDNPKIIDVMVHLEPEEETQSNLDHSA